MAKLKAMASAADGRRNESSGGKRLIPLGSDGGVLSKTRICETENQAYKSGCLTQSSLSDAFPALTGHRAHANAADATKEQPDEDSKLGVRYVFLPPKYSSDSD